MLARGAASDEGGWPPKDRQSPDELKTMSTSDMEVLLRRHLSELAATVRQDFRLEFDRFQKDRIESDRFQKERTNPWERASKLAVGKGSLANVAEDGDMRNDSERQAGPNLCKIVPVEPSANSENEGPDKKAMTEKGLKAVSMACAAFKKSRSSSPNAFHAFRTNARRNPGLQAEFEDMREDLGQAEVLAAFRQLKADTDDIKSTDPRADRQMVNTESAMRSRLAPQTEHVPPVLPNASPKGRRLVDAALKSAGFEQFVMALIVLNAVYIAIATDYMARNVLNEPPPAFIAIETIFLVAFTLEMLLRLYAYRWEMFRSMTKEGRTNTARHWNILDCFIVGSQLIDVVGQLMYDTELLRRLSILRLLRLIRLARIVRVLSVFRFVGDLRMIVYSISRSFTVFIWSAVALLLATFLFSVLFAELVLTYKIQNAGRDTEQLDKFFGSLMASMMSLIQSITGGVDWGDVAEALGQLDHSVGTMALVIYIFFAVLAMMNVITGVFLDTAMDRAREERELMLVRNARSVFAAADHKKNGMITWPDFERAVDHADVCDFFTEIDLDASEAKNLFDLIDTSGDGTISAEEFLCGCLRLRGAAKALDLLVLSREVSSLFRSVTSQLDDIFQQQKLMLQRALTPQPIKVQARATDHESAAHALPGCCNSPSPAPLPSSKSASSVAGNSCP